MKRLLAVILLVLVSRTCLAQDKERDIERFFNRYVEMLKKAEYTDALNCWALYDRTISDQLHMQYVNEPVKLEMESPLWRHIAELRSGAASLEVDTVRFSRDFARINYTIKEGDKVYTGRTFAVSESVLNPAFVSPLHVYCESWEDSTSRFMRLKYRDASLFQGTALEAADRFVEETGRKIGLSNEQLIILETIKFNAFLCESYGEVEQISGKLALGSFMPSMDAVLSKYMPPYHELAQFLVNFAMKDVPSHTLPIMKYGTATFLGGRWGRSADVLRAMGAYLYLNDLATLDTLMTVGGFESFEANPDFAYPLAGLFCEYLWNKLGRDQYFDLYRKLSGAESDINGISVGQFKEIVGTTVGQDFVAIEADFKSSLQSQKYSAITPGGQDKGKLIFESGTASMHVRVLEDSTYYNFVVKLTQTDAQGTVLLGNMVSTLYRSSLFAEQFSDSAYRNQVYGVRFSTAEVGTYNYYTNEITGKYIVGMTADAPLTDKSGKELRFKVEKRLLSGFEQYVSKLTDSK